MSNVINLNEVQRATDGLEAAKQLAALLDLQSVGLSIMGARMIGRGGGASADLILSDRSTITFEAVRDVANPGRLSTEVAACTGATPMLKREQALRAVALLRTIAMHQATFTADDIARDWGTDYLQAVEILDVDMDAQDQRWAAFSRLTTLEPGTRFRESGGHRAAATVALRDTQGNRYVRCGWFRECVRAQDSSASPQQLAIRMERVGWQKRGSSGRIKATRPGLRGQLGWTFFVVPPGWEDS